MNKTEKFKRLLADTIPDTWTHGDNIELGLPFLFRLKVIGVDWCALNDVAALLAEATKRGLIEFNPENKHQIRRTFK